MRPNTYDVAICGAGVAGLTLARQLKLKMPDISIVLFDRLVAPLPEATFKVGESTLYRAAYYLDSVLQLKDYLENNHLIKLGLRYFLGNSQGQFHERSEIGLSEFDPLRNTYQIDRGRLENDLRKLNVESGVELIENCFVRDVQLSDNPKEHAIFYSQGDNKEINTCKAHWVIDAMGRRRFLQKKLGLAEPNDQRFSAVWFRIGEIVDVSSLVPSSQTQWHERVPNNIRYYSTNHLCGKGYWIWLIALASGHTSIGIVTNEEVHPFKGYHTYELAYQWLEKHEPMLALHLKGKQPEDFKKMPKYSYSSAQVFSINRWGCTGEAATFPDPLFSPGMDLIAYANTSLTHLIELDFEGKMSQETVDKANRSYLKTSDGASDKLHNFYFCFANPTVMAAKYIWHVASLLSMNVGLFLNYGSLGIDGIDRLQNSLIWERFSQLSFRMEQLFLDWAAKSTRQVSFEFIDYWKLPFLIEVRSLNLTLNKSEESLMQDGLTCLEICEELAQAIFLLAVADTMPKMRAKLPTPLWINACAISLEPDNWEREGLFKPESKPRDLRRVMETLHSYFQIPEPILAKTGDLVKKS